MKSIRKNPLLVKIPSFRLRYFSLFLLLLVAEILIARFFTDPIIRPFIGDALAVMLVYCFLRAFIHGHARIIATGAFLFACTLEIVQWFRLGEIWGLHPVLRIVLGSTFDPIDLIAYTVGFLLCLLESGMFHKIQVER